MTAVAIQTGDRRGGYTFVRRIGKGAFGEVWRALHAPSGETVAVKVQAASPGRSAPLTRRIVQLRHPNIVMTRERVETDGLVLTVMELVEGRSLREELAERGTLPLDEAVEIADQLLQGLSHAHGAGVAHLDLKPENVLVAGRRARLCDFGSAREVAAAAAEPELTRSLDSEDPSAAHIVGSIGYMAPEQRLGFAHASTRSDIYSFGVILHEMLTGQLPLGAFRYPSAVHAEIPASVDDVVQRCLQPSPERRFADAEEARQALREAAIAPGGAVAPLQMRGVEEVRSVREFVEYVLGSPAGWEEGRRQLADGELESWLR
ncbi:MAG TPA: serine/threonine-protein kinase, partial [Planctomycetota bacterium]|nr:serine/threonine-protein kinase [Planctomycetota bacterium]